MKKNRIDVITLGCAKNLVDSERLMHMFTAVGYNVVHDAKRVSGEVVVVNTCGFIGDAKEESVNTILRMVEAKKVGGIGKLYVLGCLSERYRNDLQELIPEVDGYYGKFDWKLLLRDIDRAYKTTSAELRKLTTPQHFAYLKISEGCNRKCSYCAIPLITGKHKSRSIESLVEEARLLAQNGVKELQLIAQDLSYYGKDLYQKTKLATLLKELAKLEGIERIRLHYAYPTDFPMDILSVMANEPKICRYLDIALQHASDHMLKLMRRGISKQKTEDLLSRIREEVPGIHIRTTMMVGHPGETEEDYEELLSFMRKQRFERLGAFAYSHEEDTYCDLHYEDDIPLTIKQARLSELMQIQETISQEIAEEKVSQCLRIIVDRKEKDYFIGRTEYDSPDIDPEVLLPLNLGDNHMLRTGEFYDVHIHSTLGLDLVGEFHQG